MIDIASVGLELLLDIATAVLSIAVVFISYRVFTFFINTDLAEPLEIIGLGFLVFTIRQELVVVSKMGILSVPLGVEIADLIFMAIVLVGVYRFRKTFFVYNWLKGIDVRDLTKQQVEDLRWLVKVYTEVKQSEKKLEREAFFEKLGVKAPPKAAAGEEKAGEKK